jgi:hypothetical protein
MATLVHENFDRLTGAVAKPRSRDDKLDSAIFDQVKSKLGLCAGINMVASKFIAHAADAGSRGELSDKERGVTMNRMEACQRIICRVAAYIHGPLLYIGESGLIPTPQFNQLEHFEKGWLDSANTETLARYWEKRAEKVEKWTKGGWDNLLNMPR